MALNPFSDEALGEAREPAPFQPTKTLNPFSDEVLREAGRGRLAVNLQAGVDGNPDAAARAVRLGEEFKIAPEYIEQNLDVAERMFRLQELDPIRLEEEAPRTADLLREDPYTSRAVADHVEKLVGFEKWVKGLGQVASMSASRGYHMTELGTLYYREAGLPGMPALAPAERARMATLERAAAETLPLEDSKAAWVVNSIAEIAGQQGSQMVRGAPLAAKGAMVAGGAAALASAAAGPAAPVVGGISAPAAAAAGAYAGYTAQSVTDTYLTEAGHAWREISQMRDVAGRPIDQEAARGAAVLVGVVNAGIEFGTLGLAAKALGLDPDSLARKLGVRGVKESVKDALLHSPTARAALAKFAKRAGQVASIEAFLEEVPQELVNVLSGILAQKQDGSAFESTDWGEVAGRLGEVGAKTFVGSLFMGGANALPSLQWDLRQAQEAKNTRQMFDALAQQAAGTELRERLPSRFKEAYDRITQGTPVESVYVKADKLFELFQADPTNKETWGPLKQALPEVTDQLETALMSGGFVKMSTGDFAAHIAGTELYQGIADDIKFREDSMTVNEAVDWERNYENDYLRELELAARDAEEIERSMEPADIIQRSVTQQLRNAGVNNDVSTKYASLWRAAISTMAQRAGMDPLDLYNRYNPQVQSEIQQLARREKVERLDLLLDRVRSGKGVPTGDMFGPSLMEFIAKRGGMQDQGGELSARDLQAWHRGQAFRPRLVREDGATLEDMAHAAMDAGFFPGVDETRIGPDVLLEAIDRELSGQAVYSPNNFNEALAAEAEQVNGMADFLEANGLDPRTLSNDELKVALRQLAEGKDVELPPTVREFVQATSEQRGSAVEMFDPAAVAEHAEVAYKSRDKLVELPIDTFLKLALPGEDTQKEATVRELMGKGTRFNSLPQLSMSQDKETGDFKVDGHEGRHRARALKAAGYRTMPVLLSTDMRWTEQQDPELFDYREKWPTKIVSEDGTSSVPMPVSREDAAKPYVRELFQRRRPVEEIRNRTFEEVAARIPDAWKVVSPNPMKMLDGRDFDELANDKRTYLNIRGEPQEISALDEAGPGFLPLHADPEWDARTPWRRRAADERLAPVLEEAMRQAVEEAVLPADRAARIVVPRASQLDRAFRLSGRSRYWYEMSAKGFAHTYFDLAAAMVDKLIDLVAATSGGKEPKQNVRDAIAVLSQYVRGVPITVGQRDPASITNALNPKPINTHKFGNFAGTMQLLAGMREGKPLPTIDLQMAKYFGLTQEEVSTDPTMYETLARFMLKVRDMQNEYQGEGAQPYESWQTQAVAWVDQRRSSEPDDYAMHMPKVIEDLAAAGIPLKDGKISMETLLDPRTAEVLAPTSRSIGEARVLTLETRNSLTEVGVISAQLYRALRGVNESWARKAREEFETIQRRAMRALGQRQQKQKAPSMLSDLVAAITGRPAKLTRVDTNGLGTFEDEASPNMRIPLAAPGVGQEIIVLDEVERRALLAYLGRAFNQKATAASQFDFIDDDAEPDTWTILVPRFDNEDITEAQLAEFGRALGYPLNYAKVPNGWVIDINVGGAQAKPTLDMIDSALVRVFPGVAPDLIPRSYSSDYLEASEYETAIAALEERGQGDNKQGGRRKAVRGRPDLGRLNTVLEGIGAVAREQEARFSEWIDKYGERAAGVARSRTLYQSAVEEQLASPEFKEFFGASFITTPENTPLRVFHATTRDFSEFQDATSSNSHSNPENFLGKAHYFTSSPVDASENYAGKGPDLRSRLESIKDQIDMDEWWSMAGFDEREAVAKAAGLTIPDSILEEDEYFAYELREPVEELIGSPVEGTLLKRDVEDMLKEAIAERQLDVQNQGFVMPFYLSMQNPVVLDNGLQVRNPRWRQTVFSAERDMDYYMDMARQEVDQADYEGDAAGYRDALEEWAYNAFYEDMSPRYVGQGEKVMDALNNLMGQVESDHARERVAEIVSLLMQDEQIRANEMYQALTEALQYETDFDGRMYASELIRQFFEDAGYDGVIMDASRFNMPGTGRATHFIVFSNKQMKSQFNRGTWDRENSRFMEQRDDGTKRGSIQLPADGAGPVTINLFRKHDLSTFLHESGHFFLHMFHDLASQPDAREDVVQDWQRIATWLDVKPDQRDLTVDQHEKFARGFEAYLMEGKAPAVELESIFARFRSWLVGIYRVIRNLNVELDDEMRGVFDRMLATDEQIAAARSALNVRPLFDSAEAMGVSQDEFESYYNVAQRAHDAALAEHEARLIAEYKRTQMEEYREKREAVREEVVAEVSRQPVYRALHFLKHGRMPDGDETLPPFKLDKTALVQMFAGREVLKRIPGVGKYGIYRNDGGVHPDQAAEILGFRGGEEMVLAIINAEPVSDVVERTTDERMRELYGDMLRDGRAEESAMAAVHNDARSAMLMAEARALSKRDTKARMAPLDTARRLARETIARQQVRTATSPGVYVRTEQAAARAAERALIAGNTTEAARQKRIQLLNHHLAAEAYKARQEVADMLRYFKRFDGKGARKSVDPEYLAQIHALLERYDLRQVSQRQVDRRQSLREWADAKAAQGFQVVLDDKLLNDARRQHYSRVPVEELRGLRDAVRNIEHLGRLKDRLLKARDKAEFLAVVDGLENVALAHADYKQEPLPFGRGAWDHLKGAARAFNADHIRPEFAFEYMDSNQPGGAWWSTFFRPLADAEAAEAARMRSATEVWGNLLKLYTRRERARWHADRRHFPALNVTLTKEERLAIALNWGNQDNRQKLLDGYAQAGWTPAGVQEVIDSLDQRDWQFVQGVWDLIDSFWPDIEAMQKRLTGVAPAKVDATPVQTKFGTLRGGYYPLKYDGNQASQALRIEEKTAVQEAFGGNWAKAQTRKGHTIERKDGVRMPIRLSLNVATEHIENVIHDLEFREVVFDLDRLLQDDRVEQSIKGVLGTEFYRTLRPWLQSIASDRAPPSPNFLDRILARARHGMSVVAMGWSIGTGLAQVTGYTQSVALLGEQYALRGLTAFYKNPAGLLKSAEFITSRSEFMRNRVSNMDRDIRDMGKHLGARSALSAVDQTYFAVIGLGDAMVSMPTWLGAYHQGLDLFQGDEAKAIAHADRTVRMSQGSGAPKDLAAVQRGSELHRMFTMFYSYFAVLNNMLRRTKQNTRGMADAPRAALSFLYLVVIPAVLTDLIVGRGPEDDDEWLSWAAGKIVTYPLMSMVLLRDLAQVVSSLSTGEPTFGYRLSPVADAFAKLADTMVQAQQGEIDESLVRSVTGALGIWLKLPTNQVWKSGHYLHHYFDGDIADFSIYDMLVKGYKHK